MWHYSGLSYAVAKVVLGKIEGEEYLKELHGHVTALTVAP